MDLEWIIDTPMDDYEVGEELYFRTSTWVYVTGKFLRQLPNDIVIKVTDVQWGPEDWKGTEMTFTKDSICEKINLDSMFTVYKFEESYTYDWTELECEELLREEEDEIYNPIVIGETNSIVKGKNHIDRKDSRPRDGPTVFIVYNKNTLSRTIVGNTRMG